MSGLSSSDAETCGAPVLFSPDMTTLYIEPFGGFAGDMFLGALLDLGDERFGFSQLESLAAELVGEECELEHERTRRGSIAGTHFTLRTVESADPPHRHLSDLIELLGRASLSELTRSRCVKALTLLAEAEARVHDIPVEQVHFHEVGAVDTLVDIAGAMLALELLDVTRVHASAPLVGEGTVRCAHGEMPVPAPAVAELLRGVEYLTGGGCERLTPTGACVLMTIVDEWAAPAAFRLARAGYGAGTKDPSVGPPNLCRVQLALEDSERTGRALTRVWQVECNLDDTTGEELGWCLSGLREAGALDVWSVPVGMKKGRPGVVVCALSRAGDRPAIEEVLFSRTPTLGLRWRELERSECERDQLEVEVLGRTVRVKRRLGGASVGVADLSPEQDDLEALARETGLPLREVGRLAIEAALKAQADPSES
ncbi:MAG: nickel pincer cofactor biosynthesis protein LarC [Planctomycetota bacterium]|nr:nickel pincer cofactor biosynthesis protein LarC [Planctomycetota bacterium]